MKAATPVRVDTAEIEAMMAEQRQEPEQEPAEDHVHEPTAYTPDTRVLEAAKGEAMPWADEVVKFFGNATGEWVTAGSLSVFFEAYRDQVEKIVFREAAFMVANTTLPPAVEGDPSFLMLSLRDELTKAFRKRAGL